MDGGREGGREKERKTRRARGASCEKRREMRRTWKEKRKDDSEGRGGEEERRTKKRPRCIRCLAETGDDGKNGDGGQLGKRDRREEERKECICGLLDRVGGRVRRLGRALRWWEPRPRERTQAGQPGADLDRRNVRTNGNSAYTYYRIHRRERERTYTPATATRWEFAVLARTLNILADTYTHGVCTYTRACTGALTRVSTYPHPYERI